MNKLYISNNICINDIDSELIIEDDVNIDISGNNKIYISNKFNKVTFNIMDNSSLDIYINNICNIDNIVINQNNNTIINLRYNFISNDNNNINIINNINGNNNISNIIIKNISNKGISNIDVLVNVNNNTSNNNIKEIIKGINNGGKIIVNPNIICNSNLVNAYHSAVIKGIDKNIINYLMMKGLSFNNAKKLYLNGFIRLDEGRR